MSPCVLEGRQWAEQPAMERILRAGKLLHGLQAPACDCEPYLTMATLCPLLLSEKIFFVGIGRKPMTP